jgi:WS/DGAT/MGAT family acyltransferase
MSAADSAWLRMDEPDNLMTITGVLAFETAVDRAALRALLAERLVGEYPRFRWRVEAPSWGLGRPTWREDPDFDLDRHLVDARLPAPAGKEELQDLVSSLMSQPLDPERPLWQFHYVANFRYGSAIVARVHHAIGDGMSLVQMLLGLAAPAEGQAAWTPPSVRKPSVGGWAAIALGAVPSLLRVLLRRADPPSALRGDLHRNKRCAWSGPLPLEDVKDLSRRLGVTINDLLITAVAGALRSHLLRHHQDVEGLALRAVVPVNLRGAEDLKPLGNRFGLVFLPIPVGEADPRRRLEIVKRGMDRVKRSPEAMVTHGLLRLIGWTAPAVVSWAVRFFGRKATAVMTNVPGPREPLVWCGEPVDGAMFWVPQSGRLGLGVSILSYAGSVRVGVASDENLVPDPQSIVDGYGQALEELRSVYSS